MSTTSIGHIYQPPLTRKVQGHGLILVLSDSYSLEHTSSRPSHLDPLPLQKWAEEGFCVFALLVPQDDQRNPEDWQKLILYGLEELRQKDELIGETFGLIGAQSV